MRKKPKLLSTPLDQLSYPGVNFDSAKWNGVYLKQKDCSYIAAILRDRTGHEHIQFCSYFCLQFMIEH